MRLYLASSHPLYLLEEDALDRELQSTELAKIMAASHRPVIFLGYVVTKPWMSRRAFHFLVGAIDGLI